MLTGRHSKIARYVELTSSTRATQIVEAGQKWRIAIVQGSGTVVVKRGSEILASITSGNAFLTAAANESWTIEATGAIDVALGPVLEAPADLLGDGLAVPLYGARAYNADESSATGSNILGGSDVCQNSAIYHPAPAVPFVLDRIVYANSDGGANAASETVYERKDGASFVAITVASALELADGTIVPLFAGGSATKALVAGESCEFRPERGGLILDQAFWVKSYVQVASAGTYVPKTHRYDNGVQDFVRNYTTNTNNSQVALSNAAWSSNGAAIGGEPYTDTSIFGPVAIYGILEEPAPLWSIWGDSRRRGHTDFRSGSNAVSNVARYDDSDVGRVLENAGLPYARVTRGAERGAWALKPANSGLRSSLTALADVLVWGHAQNDIHGGSYTLEQTLQLFADFVRRYGRNATLVVPTCEPYVNLTNNDATTLDGQTINDSAKNTIVARFNAILRGEATPGTYGVSEALSPFAVAGQYGSAIYVADVASAVEHWDGSAWSGKYKVPAAAQITGTASGGSVARISDTTKTGQTRGSFFECFIKTTGGTGSGQTRRCILDVPESSGLRWYVHSNFSPAPDATTTYEVWRTLTWDGLHPNAIGRARQSEVWKALVGK